MKVKIFSVKQLLLYLKVKKKEKSSHCCSFEIKNIRMKHPAEARFLFLVTENT